MLHFENPFAFLFLLSIPLYYLLRKFGILVKISFPLTISDWNGKTFSWNASVFKVARIVSTAFFILGYFSLIVAWASPVILKQEKVFTSKGSEIVFVLDTSPSMAAKDVGVDTRLNIAKNAIKQMIENMQGTSFGLVALGSEAAIIVPPTTDYDFFKIRLNNLKIGEMGEGTALGTGISSAVLHLSNSQAPKKSIILLTDGENNAGVIHPKTASRLAKEKNIKLYIIGIGTKGTVPLEYTDVKTGKRYSGYLDSNFDDNFLRTLALETDGSYFSSENVYALTDALSYAAKKEKTVQSFFYKNSKEKYFSYALQVALLAFVMSWVLRRLYMKELI
ncbi:MAG: VWA domain-containing protein [Treponema sp.]|nr:VWA domain-containing protein [Treponema sp.]